MRTTQALQFFFFLFSICPHPNMIRVQFLVLIQILVFFYNACDLSDNQRTMISIQRYVQFSFVYSFYVHGEKAITLIQCNNNISTLRP